MCKILAWSSMCKIIQSNADFHYRADNRIFCLLLWDYPVLIHWEKSFEGRMWHPKLALELKIICCPVNSKENWRSLPIIGSRLVISEAKDSCTSNFEHLVCSVPYSVQSLDMYKCCYDAENYSHLLICIFSSCKESKQEEKKLDCHNDNFKQFSKVSQLFCRTPLPPFPPSKIWFGH